MKNGWSTKTIGETCEIKPPKGEARERLAADALVSFLPMEDMGINEKFVRASQKKPLSDVQGSYTYFADGDVLLAKITPCFENGKLGIAEGLSNGIGFGSSEYIVFRPDETISKEWLYYYLSRETFRVEGAARMSGAVGHKRVAKEFIESYPIPVPPLPEQQRIVGVLDETLEGIATAKANAEKNLQNANEIFESQLEFVFSMRGVGWMEATLGDVADFKNGLNFTKNSKGQTVPIVGVGDFQTNYFVPIDSLQAVTVDGGLGEDYAIRPNDILTVRSNGSRDLVGRCMLVPKIHETISYSGFIIRIRFDTRKMSPRFLLHFMKSSGVRDRLTRDGGGANINNINQSKLSALPIAFPALSKQEALATHLDDLRKEVQRLATLYKRKLAALDGLKNSLLHQAFTANL
jgi:type I restriction enzyme, S subunit